MPSVISGDTGIDKVNDGAVVTADLADGAVTAAKLSGAQTGSAPVYGCRAWCVFNGATATILASGNVSGVVRNSVGNYTVTFATAMQDANSAVVVSATPGIVSVNTITSTTVNFALANYLGAAGDSVCSVAVFR